MDYKPDEIHAALMAQLKSHPATASMAKPISESVGSSKWVDMDINAINSGVKVLVSFWNLTGGSVGELDLYELLQVYMRNETARTEINKVVGEHLFINK